MVAALALSEAAYGDVMKTFYVCSEVRTPIRVHRRKRSSRTVTLSEAEEFIVKRGLMEPYGDLLERSPLMSNTKSPSTELSRRRIQKLVEMLLAIPASVSEILIPTLGH